MSVRGVMAALSVLVVAIAAPGHATVRVVATIFPLADVVRQVGREHVDVATLLPAGASPHTFEPTPAQMRALAQARVCVRVGAGLDNWAEKLLAAHGGGLTVVTVTDGMELIGAVDGHGGDPHVWLDPVRVRDVAVPAIVAALSAADPEARAAFEHAAAEFQAALTQLDTDVRNALTPLTQREYIAFHSAWRYFGQRYGLHEIAVVEPFPGKEPSAYEVASIVDRARAAHIHAVLIEPQFNPAVAQQIAREFGGVALVVDPIGGLNIPERNHYIDLMRYNARVFSEALR